MTPFLAASLSYLLMLAAYYRPRYRFFHIPVMVSTLIFDISMPIFLYTHRHWWHRLIEEEDIFSFGVWMHLGLLFVLYILEGTQVWTGRKILLGDNQARIAHHQQGRALLMVRALILITGGILADPT
jgi:hypothetical protein